LKRIEKELTASNTETYVKEAEDALKNASKPFSCVILCSKLLRHSELFEVKKLQMQKPELKKFTNTPSISRGVEMSY